LGLISEERYQKYLAKKALKEEEIAHARQTVLPPDDKLNAILEAQETATVHTGVRLSELLKRPQLNYQLLSEVDVNRPDLSEDILEQAEIELKYEGYIKRQRGQIEEQKRLENRKLPENVDYSAITGLRLEAVEKLTKVRPVSIGQAARISGVSPADISVLLIWLERESK
jgi:tRNA uridine 5-carboxymethylaminomethyl modification enzyme